MKQLFLSFYDPLSSTSEIMKLLKLKWFNYFLLVTLLNITLHICYLYMLLQAHDTLDHTANNIYSFEQVDISF